MNPRFWLLLLWLALCVAVRADVAVTFQNNVFTPPRLVTFGDGFDSGLRGTGVRNGVDGIANYVAQLFRVVGAEEIPIGPVANFRAATTTQPGTWSGALRTIPGVQPGEEVLLRVKVWDGSKPSYEAAAQEQLPRGRSEVFVYSQPDPVLLPSDTYMVNFQGFTLDEDPCSGFFFGFPVDPDTPRRKRIGRTSRSAFDSCRGVASKGY